MPSFQYFIYARLFSRPHHPSPSYHICLASLESTSDLGLLHSSCTRSEEATMHLMDADIHWDHGEFTICPSIWVVQQYDTNTMKQFQLPYPRLLVINPSLLALIRVSILYFIALCYITMFSYNTACNMSVWSCPPEVQTQCYGSLPTLHSQHCPLPWLECHPLSLEGNQTRCDQCSQAPGSILGTAHKHYMKRIS